MKHRPLLTPEQFCKASINEMSVDQLIAYLNAADEDFINSFRVINSENERTEYLTNAVEYRSALIKGNEDKFKTANYFKPYETLNFEFFSKAKAILTEEFVDNLRGDIEKLYSEVINELLSTNLDSWIIDFKRINEFKYFLNQIILNKYNYIINRSTLVTDEEIFKRDKPNSVEDIKNDLDGFIDIELIERYDFKKDTFIERKTNKSTTYMVFEKFIRYSRNPYQNKDGAYILPLRKDAIIHNSELKGLFDLSNNLKHKHVRPYNTKYILEQLKDFEIGKQTYYNYFSINDLDIIKNYLEYKQEVLKEVEEKLINLKIGSPNYNKEVAFLRQDIKSLSVQITELEKEINKKSVNSSKKLNLINKHKKTEFDKKFFINLAMYLQLDQDQIEKFLNLNGYSLLSTHEQDTIIRLLYSNNYGIQVIDLVLSSYGYKSLRISKNRLAIMEKTSYDLANEYLVLIPDEIKLLSHTDRIKHYRNIEKALNQIEKFLTNRIYNKEVSFMQLSLKHKFEFDEVEKERKGKIIGKGKVKPFGDKLKDYIYEEFEKYDDSAAIRVDEIFKTKENSDIKTQEGWFKHHKRLLEELQNFEMYYADCKTEHPEERNYIRGSIDRLIKRLESREKFIADKIKEYQDIKTELSALSAIKKLKTKQQNRLDKVEAYLKLLDGYEEPAMFYMRSVTNKEIKFSEGVTKYIDDLETILMKI